MAIHFGTQELQQRRDRVCAEIQRCGLHAMLCFRPESDYYLTSYDTFGYCFFQWLLLCADGRFALLTRPPDLRQAQHTSVIEDIRISTDQAGSNPSRQLVAMLDEYGCERLSRSPLDLIVVDWLVEPVFGNFGCFARSQLARG